MCHHVDHREWTFEAAAADDEGPAEEPEDREPSFVDPDNTEERLTRAYESPPGDD